LLVALRKYDITFYAYNITAGGLLSGSKDGARFTDSAHAERYKGRYINDSYLTAVEKLVTGKHFHLLMTVSQFDIFKTVCKQEAINPIDASIRWLVHHSMLNAKKDVLIIGASKIERK
jgi:aflatoxin B1 aldehyde reductase